MSCITALVGASQDSLSKTSGYRHQPVLGKHHVLQGAVAAHGKMAFPSPLQLPVQPGAPARPLPMRFDRVLSFGRTGEELLAMVALEPQHLVGLKVLDCPGGPGSLTALLRRIGARPTAVDPSYGLPPDVLEARTRADIQAVEDQMPGDAAFRESFDHASYLNAKLEAFRQFQRDRNDYPADYLAASLPSLPFADGSFDLVISGSLLFAYAPVSDGGLMQEPGLGLAWHRQAFAELLRVCRGELRMYPAHTLQGAEAQLHPYVAALLDDLPPGWQADTFLSQYDQGIRGEVVGLRLQAPARNAPSPAPR